MKIIDLLNKIANGEIPKTIVYDEKYFTYDEKRQNYFSYDDSEIDWKYTVMEYINDEVKIIEENKKELHANDIEFNINNDKRDCIITLDENDLGIDKLHLDNCYFYKENNKWYVKQINLKPIAYISQEHKIPEKLKIEQDTPNSNFYIRNEYGTKCALTKHSKIIADKINEIIDYLGEIE